MLLVGFVGACGVNDGGLLATPPPGAGAPSQPVVPPAPPPAPVPPTVVPPPPGTTPPGPPLPTPPIDPVSPPPPAPGPGSGGPTVPPPPYPPVAPPPPVMPPPAPVPPNGSLPGECDPITRSLDISVVRPLPPTGDLTFDSDGFLVLAIGRDIVRLTRGGTSATLVNNALLPNRTIFGLRVVPDGSVFFTDSSTDNLIRYDPRGDRRTFSMNAPVQFVRGPTGRFYVTGINGELFALDVESGQSRVLARLGGSLRGLTFSPDYKTLYVAERESRTLRSFPVENDGGLDEPRIFARNLGQGIDGLTTDICGNVYVADQSGDPLLRVTPAGRVESLDIETSLSALAFGSGRQGWDERSLYAVSEERGGLYEIRIGVRGAHPLGPAQD